MALEEKEHLLADVFGLFDSRHADRLVALERTAAHRHRCDSAHVRLDGALARIDALLGGGGGGMGLSGGGGSSPERGSPERRAMEKGLREELKEVAGLLKAASKAGTAASDAVASQEAAVQSGIAKFAGRFDTSQLELRHAKERITELERALAKAGGKAPAHRPAGPGAAPGPPKGRPRAEVGASVAGGAKAGGASPRGPPSPDWLPRNR